MEEGFTEGNRIDVWGFVNQTQPHSGGVGIEQCFRSHQDGQGCV